MSSFWTDKSVLVTGGAGFLGRHVCQALRQRGCEDLYVPRSADYDLTRPERITALLHEHPADILLHLAARVGGIGANRQAPGTFGYANLVMGAHLLEEARRAGVEKFLTVGTVCSYPKHTPVPFREHDLWNGYPEETNAAYGLAKKMLLTLSQAYRDEFDFHAIYLLPANLYGPGDNFDLQTSHVIPALIRKCIHAQDFGESEVVVWGTGSPTREFLYVKDAAAGILLAAERYNDREPINLGTGREISIRDLAKLIAEKVGFSGTFRWDASQPDGQPRRCLNTERARATFGFEASTRLEDGLTETIRWYESVRGEAPSVLTPV